MKANFNKKTIANIAITVRRYKKMYVTTKGQMFRTDVKEAEKIVEDAIRTANAILDDPNQYYGYVTITEDMVSDEKLRGFAKEPEAFNKLFDKAKIPVVKQTKVEHSRTREKAVPADADTVDSVITALGLAEKKPDETKPDETKPVETKPVETNPANTGVLLGAKK